MAARRLRALPKLALLTLPGGLALAAAALLGFWPVAPDRPALPGRAHTPGDGGLRRPFPSPRARPDNPTTPKKVALGRLLFFDPILSDANDLSCATCHHPDLGFSDGRALSMGRGGSGIGPARAGGVVVRRSAPTLWNAAFNHRQFWDGRASDLEDQARFPITSADEMGQAPDTLERELRALPEYVQLFDQAFGGAAGSAVRFENVTRALAAFERTLVSRRSRFDRYREGDLSALSASERRGLALFRSLRTRCFECHGFPTFANPDFKVIGVPERPGQPADLGRQETGGGPSTAGAFKVPTLRNVALTAPYMHNGRYRTLQEVLLFYQKGGGKGEGLELPNLDDKIRPFPLNADEQADLIAFLNALSDESGRPDFPERLPSGLPVVPRLGRGAARSAAPEAGGAEARSAGPGMPRVHRVRAGASIQAAVDAARPGDAIEVEPGVYRESLLVDAEHITLRGLTRGGRRAVLDGEGELSDAVIASGHGFRIEGFGVRRYTSNGITVHGATGVAFQDLEIEDTGLYGVYPVECRDVRVSGVSVSGARDAGIYIGQSRDIVVRANEVRGNVTGIEIENSLNALVEDNHAHGNTGGILVFLLPNNPSKIASGTRVLRNRVVANNHPNFGDPTAIVSKVPPGSGIFIMAADRTEVAHNEVRDNDSFGIALVSLRQAFPHGGAFDVGIVPEESWIHGNLMSGNGRKPAPAVQAAGGGADLLWDGSGWSNAWEQPGATSVPPLLPSRRWPAFAARAWSRIVSALARLGG